jgi:predicted nucleotidyltransferase
MVVERVKRDFSDEIVLIGLTGSFNTNDFHEKSDLDLIIVNNTDKGWEISVSFIFDDVGYDIYCTPWGSLERKAALDDVGVSSLTDLQILYCAKPEYLERYNALREKAIQKMSEGIGAECISRAEKYIDLAKQDYADMMLSDDFGAVRYASGVLLLNLVNSIVNLNNTCIKRGIRRYIDELSSYSHLPENFNKSYMALIDAKSVNDMRKTAHLLLSGVISLRDKLRQVYAEQPIPAYDNLKGWYEECWCNSRNKLIASTAAKDKSYAFLAAVSAQNYFDEMAERLGTKKYDLMQHFDSDNLGNILDVFLLIMDEYLHEYEKAGLQVLKFNTFDEVYSHFMREVRA